MSMLFAQMMPGMEWLPLMLVCIAGGLLAGVLGTLVGLAVSHSRYAFWAGSVACATGIASPLFFLLVAGRHLASDAYFVLATPLLAGLPAVLLSFRPSVRWLAEGDDGSGETPAVQQQRRKPPTWLANRTVRVTLVLTAAAVVLVWSWLNWLRPRRALERLLAGDSDVEIVAVRITGQGKQVSLSDPTVARYLTARFRSARRDGYVPEHLGLTYTIRVTFAAGGSVEAGCSLPADAQGVTISFPLDGLGDPLHYWVRFTDPLPPTIADALRHLR
ncbi:MAG TPA: hypothetical protein VEL76_09965 [Gemmataceae bacterium]|nr:hypothetical protein [Gemmataceae bacterium]